MALDFKQRSFTKTADQAVIDEGLRAYMLKVYNYMTTGLLLTGIVAYFFAKASIITNEMGQIVGLTQVGSVLHHPPPIPLLPHNARAPPSPSQCACPPHPQVWVLDSESDFLAKIHKFN